MKHYSLQRFAAYALMEAMIGMMIFTIGVLGIVSMQGNILKRSMDSKFRIQASMLANEIISLAIADSDNAACYTLPIGACGSVAAQNYMTAWQNELNAALPGSGTTPPVITLAVDSTLSVTIFWQRPADPAVHNFSAATQLE